MFPGQHKKVHFVPGSPIFVTVRPGSLEVLAYLPTPLLSHLRVVLSGNGSFVLNPTERWERFVDALNRGTADIVIVDPCADGVARSAPLAALLESRLTLPVVVYTPVSPVNFQAIAELARHSPHHGVHHVVLHRYDDEPRRFLELLERQPGTSLSAALLEELSPVLASLPSALSRGVERLVRRPNEFRDVADLARASRMTLRTAYRHLTSAGVRSPRALVVAARLLQSYGFARDPRQSLEEIARKVGYSAPRMLTKHMREAVGATPRTVRREMRPGEFVHAVAQWLAPTPMPTALLASSRETFQLPPNADTAAVIETVVNGSARRPRLQGMPVDGGLAPGILSPSTPPGDVATGPLTADRANQANDDTPDDADARSNLWSPSARPAAPPPA